MTTAASPAVPSKLPASAASFIAAPLRAQVLNRPQAEAVVFGEHRLTYSDLDARSGCIAQQLHGLGIEPGDRVAILFTNHHQYVASFFAASGLGAVVVPINPLLKSEEIAHVLADSGAKVVITQGRGLPEVRSAMALVPTVQHVIVYREKGQAIDLPELPIFQLMVDESLSTSWQWPELNCNSQDLAVLVYTSGTTGKPKGAMLTHGNLLHAASSVCQTLQAKNSDRVLAVLPLCHIYGLTAVMLAVLSQGATMVIQEKFEAPGALKLIQEEKVTLVPLVPAMYQFLLLELENNFYDLSSVRACLCGASALPAELISKLESAFGAPLLEAYGLTEVACMGNANPLDGPRKAGSVGPPFPGMQVNIFGDNRQRLLPGPDNVGEIAIKGPSVMMGYYRQPESTAEVLHDGWFFTGDLGYCDEDGYVFVVGRKKEMIIRGGQNIYPREIEDVIVRMSQVAEVAVIGVPDKFMGERVKAVVVVRPGQILTEADVKLHCSNHLAEYKVPRLVEFVPALPRNSTGKVLKRLLS